MKRMVVFTLFLILIAAVSAQETDTKVYKYYRVYESGGILDGGIKVFAEDGNLTEVLIDEEGNSFKSVFKAINYMAEAKNWELMQIYTITNRNGVEMTYYLMRVERIKKAP